MLYKSNSAKLVALQIVPNAIFARRDRVRVSSKTFRGTRNGTRIKCRCSFLRNICLGVPLLSLYAYENCNMGRTRVCAKSTGVGFNDVNSTQHGRINSSF